LINSVEAVGAHRRHHFHQVRSANPDIFIPRFCPSQERDQEQEQRDHGAEHHSPAGYAARKDLMHFPPMEATFISAGALPLV